MFPRRYIAQKLQICKGGKVEEGEIFLSAANILTVILSHIPPHHVLRDGMTILDINITLVIAEFIGRVIKEIETDHTSIRFSAIERFLLDHPKIMAELEKYSIANL